MDLSDVLALAVVSESHTRAGPSRFRHRSDVSVSLAIYIGPFKSNHEVVLITDSRKSKCLAAEFALPWL
jgi:hypothetical protein